MTPYNRIQDNIRSNFAYLCGTTEFIQREVANQVAAGRKAIEILEKDGLDPNSAGHYRITRVIEGLACALESLNEAYDKYGFDATHGKKDENGKRVK